MLYKYIIATTIIPIYPNSSFNSQNVYIIWHHNLSKKVTSFSTFLSSRIVRLSIEMENVSLVCVFSFSKKKCLNEKSFVCFFPPNMTFIRIRDTDYHRCLHNQHISTQGWYSGQWPYIYKYIFD